MATNKKDKDKDIGKIVYDNYLKGSSEGWDEYENFFEVETKKANQQPENGNNNGASDSANNDDNSNSKTTRKRRKNSKDEDIEDASSNKLEKARPDRLPIAMRNIVEWGIVDPGEDFESLFNQDEISGRDVQTEFERHILRSPLLKIFASDWMLKKHRARFSAHREEVYGARGTLECTVKIDPRTKLLTFENYFLEWGKNTRSDAVGSNLGGLSRTLSIDFQRDEARDEWTIELKLETLYNDADNRMHTIRDSDSITLSNENHDIRTLLDYFKIDIGFADNDSRDALIIGINGLDEAKEREIVASALNPNKRAFVSNLNISKFQSILKAEDTQAVYDATKESIAEYCRMKLLEIYIKHTDQIRLNDDRSEIISIIPRDTGEWKIDTNKLK